VTASHRALRDWGFSAEAIRKLRDAKAIA